MHPLQIETVRVSLEDVAIHVDSSLYTALLFHLQQEELKAEIAHGVKTKLQTEVFLWLKWLCHPGDCLYPTLRVFDEPREVALAKADLQGLSLTQTDVNEDLGCSVAGSHPCFLPGDIIVRVNGKDVRGWSPAGVSREILNAPDVVNFAVRRGTTASDEFMTVVFGEGELAWSYVRESFVVELRLERS